MSEPADRLPQTRTAYASPCFDRPELSPLALFRRWYDEAAEQLGEPNAMVVSTLDEWGPASRIVLLKGVEASGFVFFTDYDSLKGRQLRADPRIAVSFPWQDMARQVRIRGLAEVVPGQESDAYFAQRPRGSQIAASVSRQSRPVTDRAQMEAEYEAAEHEYAGRAVPRPEHWGGLRIRPFEIEFWQGRQNRFHDRWVFRRADGSRTPADLALSEAWETVRLYP